MPTVEMIILAKSRKLGGKCIAGLRTNGEGWVRPVSPVKDGTLYEWHYTLSDGSEARVLDVVAINCIEPRPEPHQPENWLISNEPWRLIARPATPEHQKVIWSHIMSGPKLLGNQSDKIQEVVFKNEPAKASLVLVTPQKLGWILGKPGEIPRKIRATFELSGAKYNLAVTDPDWEMSLEHLPEGNHQTETGEKFLLLVSLGEPFKNNCYKLVSSVLRIE